MLRIAVVDDEKEMRKTLCSFLDRFSEEYHTGQVTVEFSSGDEFLLRSDTAFDIVIFDIDMPGTNGMDTARKVHAQDPQVVILFVTNIAQYAINGYEVEAVDYMLKPIGYYDFAMKFQKAVRRVSRDRPEHLVLDTAAGPVRVNVSEILYVEVLSHYLIYHTKDATCQVRGTMKEQEEKLRSCHFCRTHKSYMVNLRWISSIRGSVVRIGDKDIPLGRAYKDTLMKEYLHYLHG